MLVSDRGGACKPEQRMEHAHSRRTQQAHTVASAGRMGACTRGANNMLAQLILLRGCSFSCGVEPPRRYLKAAGDEALGREVKLSDDFGWANKRRG